MLMQQFTYYEFQIRQEDFEQSIKKIIFLEPTEQLTIEQIQASLYEVNQK